MQSVGPPRPKEALGNVNDYEILLMLDADLDEARHNEIISRTRDLVEQGGGTWVGHDPWGRRKLAYEIDKKTDGVYHLLQFDAEPATLDEITRVLKITDGVMRHMATRRVKGGGRLAAPPPLPPVEERPRYDRDERRDDRRDVRRDEAPPLDDEAPAAEAAAESAAPAEAEPVEAENAVAEPEAEGYAEPTESEAPETAPEEEA